VKGELRVSWIDLDAAGAWEGYRWLDAVERDRVAGVRSAPDRRRLVAAHVAVRRLLGDRLGIPPGAVRFDRRCRRCGHPSHGRPELEGGLLSFSLARARGVALVAVSGTGIVGADVEAVDRPWSEFGGVAFAPAERAALAACDPPRRAQLAAALWTRKEAVVKALGVGLARPLASFDCLGAVARVAGEPLVGVRDIPAPHGLAAALAHTPILASGAEHAAVLAGCVDMGADSGASDCRPADALLELSEPCA